ncbi:MAG: hypothetical protein HY763_15510 [Planctomycetes bacterium]|nr:hypothetical protein [Planctomycetota bacterium]
MYTQQLIDEYFEPDAYESRFDRPIPIRYVRESRPTMELPAPPAGEITGRQLELPLAPARPTPSSDVRPATTAAAGAASVRLAPGDDAPERGPSLRGFLSGCAVGGAVAAALLLIVQLLTS